jgi:hypothetical protein
MADSSKVIEIKPSKVGRVLDYQMCALRDYSLIT